MYIASGLTFSAHSGPPVHLAMVHWSPCACDTALITCAVRTCAQTTMSMRLSVSPQYSSWISPPVNRVCEKYVACWCSTDEPVDKHVEEPEHVEIPEHVSGGGFDVLMKQQR